MSEQPGFDRIVRMAELSTICGLKRTQVQKEMRLGAFPKPIRLNGGRAIGWLQSELAEWIRRRKEMRDNADAA